MLAVVLKISVAIFAFLLGSIPFSYLVSKLFGHMDIRLVGSGNIGATNVTRNLGVKLGFTALVFDFLKGFIACWIGYEVGGLPFATWCGVFAVLGHCCTPFLRFHGGKGVATSAGVIAFLMPQVLPWLVLIFFGTMILFRYVSISSIITAISFPILAIVFNNPSYLVFVSLGLSSFVIYRHWSNIRKLINGTEEKTKKRFLLF